MFSDYVDIEHYVPTRRTEMPAYFVVRLTFLLRILPDIRYMAHPKCVVYSRRVENFSAIELKIFRLRFEASAAIFYNNILEEDQF